MSYYHIVVETNDKDEKKKFIQILECDKEDILEIKSDVLKPYILKEEVYVDGAYIKYDNIRSLKVKRSTESSSVLTKRANDNVPKNFFVFITVENVISGNSYVEDITRDLVKEVKQEVSILEKKEAIQLDVKNNNKKVFIVHGRDVAAKSEVARYLEKLDMDPIILHEQASSSNTIIEKIEAHSDVGYAVIIYTPCDQGSIISDNLDLKARARQNVVFEHGYFIGRLGRSRVTALKVEGVETPNDISGVVYIDLDTRGAWRIELARELRNAGYSVNYSAII